MGIFSVFKKKKKKDNESLLSQSSSGEFGTRTASGSSAQKHSPIPSWDSTIPVDDSQEIKLTKSKEDFSEAIKLTKQNTGIDLSSAVARVAVVMDISGSMEDQYNDGRVQNILTRLLPFALQFDDNGELEVYLFSNDCEKVEPPMTEKNYSNYVETYILGKYHFGGTNYAPAVRMTDDFYNDKESKHMPTLVLFITDGENWDEDETNEAIRRSAKHGIFYEFIGTGNSNYSYLKSLDDLEGRVCDNTGFIQIKDFEKAANVQVFLDSLKDYVPWLKTKNYIK